MTSTPPRMSSSAHPLSPSRAGNFPSPLDASTEPGPPARPPRKRLVLEPDQDFFDAALLAEAEMEGQEEPEDDQYAPPEDDAPNKDVGKDAPGHDSDVEMAEEEVFVRRGVREGKKRLVLVPDEDFAAEPETRDEDVGMGEAPERLPRRDYAAPDLSSVNMSSRNLGYVEAAPIAATSFDGRKITFKRRKRPEGHMDSAAQKKEMSDSLAHLSKSMLETPYLQMINDIASAKKQADVDATNVALDEYMAPLETSLWTDRYRPKKFTELLGDERVHRAALLWLKEWDTCVFPGTSKTTAAAELKRERRKKRARDGKQFGVVQEVEVEEVQDTWGRPNEKILLLSGPPGLGKTTLAYVLAHQAGYQVLEVNASDERTGKVVDDRIKPALESRALSMNGSMAGNKPTCIVIDEIDGAAGGGEAGFVPSLIKLITAGSSGKWNTGGKTKKKGESRPLLRPIICICNDLYTPALRPLRPYARIIKFTPPTNAMVVQRLRTICIDEGLKADSKHLTMLTEVAEGDLRSCLNTLQFIKRRTPIVDEASIRSTSIGKDMGTSSKTVIANLFKKPPRKKGATGEDKYVTRIVRDVDTCGEHDWIATGCFENYLGARQTNDTFPRILDGLDWLYFYERINSCIKEDQEQSLRPYLPFAFPAWYKLFSSHTPKKAEYSKVDYDAKLRSDVYKEVLDEFAHSLPAELKMHFTTENIAVELLPQLNRIISPDLKPVNSQLIKSDERAIMLKLVNTMLSMNLFFVQSKNEEGQAIYKLEPAIDVFIHYDGKRAEDLGPSRYAVRHMLATEMKTEELRRHDGGKTAVTFEEIIAAYKVKPTATTTVAGIKDPTDFFGRAITIKPKTEEEELAPPPPKSVQHAVYRYHEGFSNAVRLVKRVGDFLV